MAVNYNQLVVEAMLPGSEFLESPARVVLVYEVDSLISQSADQEIIPRMFEIDEPGFTFSPGLYLDKTSVTTGLQGRDTVKLITLNFWNTEN